MFRLVGISIVIGSALFTLLGLSIFPKSPPLISEAYSHTPTPSFDPEIRENFLALLTIDEDCLFPCWQDLTLGESSIENAKEVSSALLLRNSLGRTPFGNLQDYEREFNYSYLPGVVADGTAVNLSVYATSDHFSAISIWYLGYDTSTQTEVLPNQYQIESVVEAYGFPDEIWLLGSPHTDIILVYSEQGLLIEYERIELQPVSNQTGTRTICPEDFAGFTLIGYIPGELDLSASEREETLLDATADISPKALIELIVNRDSPCVETPLSIWGFSDLDPAGNNSAP